MEMYRVLTNDATRQSFWSRTQESGSSHGMAVDSGILTVVFSLGWLGSLLFAAGIVSLFLRRKSWPANDDDFSGVAKAIMIAILVQVVGGNVFVSVTGVNVLDVGRDVSGGRIGITRVGARVQGIAA